MIKFFKRKKKVDETPPLPEAKQPRLNLKKIKKLIPDIFIMCIDRPFNRLTKHAHDITVDVYPSIKVAKIKKTVSEISYKDEADLCAKIKKYYESK